MSKHLKRCLLPVAFWTARVWWFVRRPHTKGVKCLVTCDDAMLLVRLSYSHKLWSIPGGGVHTDESDEAAIRREILEETGITLGTLRFVGSYTQEIEYKHDTVACYHAQVTTRDVHIDGIEISEATWFRRDNLPTDRATSIDRILQMI